MPSRVLPTDRIRDHIDELFAEGWALPEILVSVYGSMCRAGYG